jgi:hypothetical protein
MERGSDGDESIANNMLIKNFLAYLPGADGEAENREAERIAGWAKERGRPTLHSGYFLAYEGYAGRETAAPLGKPRDRIFLHVLPGAALSPVTGETEALPPTMAAWESWADRRVDLFNLIRTRPTELHIISDVLGLLPYWIGKLEMGIVVSSSIHDVLSAFPELARPFDPMGISNYLIGGRGTRTVHARIRSSSAGATLRWTEWDGPDTDRDRRLRPIPLEPDLSSKDAINRVVELLASNLGSFLEGSKDGLLPLTGGFDSRLMACILKEAGIPCQTVTLGNRFHSEVKVARRIAKILRLPHTLLEPRGDLLDRVPLLLTAQNGHCRYESIYITEFLDRGYSLGTPILHGLLGGNLAYGGAFFSSSELQNTPQSMARFLANWIVRELQPDFADTLRLPGGVEAYVEEITADLVPAESLLHPMFIWDLENRQPRGVGAQLPYLGQEYRVGAPFYDREQISAWMAIPRMGHEDRRLLRWIFQERFPALASIPHAEEQPYLLPNSVASTRHLTALLARRAGDGVLRRLLPGHIGRIRRRDIWHFWHGSTPKQVDRQMEALAERRRAVVEVLGWAPADGATEGEDFWDRITTTPQRADQIRNAFFVLAEYCAWLKGTIPGI